MRVPRTIPDIAKRVYEPSGATLKLEGESGRQRTLRTEDTQWDKKLLPRLSTLVLEELATEFSERPRLSDLQEPDRGLHCDALHLLELLPLDLDLKKAMTLVPDGVYWERRARSTWQSNLFPQYYGNSWKRMVAERTIEEQLEQLEPDSDGEDEVREQLRVVAPEVRRVRLRELRRCKPFSLPEHPADTDIPDPQHSDHFDLGIVLEELPALEELEVVYTRLNLGADGYDPAEMRVSIQDCHQLGTGVARSENLSVLRLRRSRVEDLRLAALLRPLAAAAPAPTPGAPGAPNPSPHRALRELDFSHCQIGDAGALALAKVATVLPSLKVVILVNNKIGGLGAKGLSYAMSQMAPPESGSGHDGVESRAVAGVGSVVHGPGVGPGVGPGIGLDRLDLRLNPLGDVGGQFLAAALSRNLGPRDLGLAACGIENLGGLHLAEALHYNCRLQALNVSSNPQMGLNVSRAFTEAMAVNSWLLQLDLRDTGASPEDEEVVRGAVRRNRERHRDQWERQQEAERAQREDDERLQRELEEDHERERERLKTEQDYEQEQEREQRQLRLRSSTRLMRGSDTSYGGGGDSTFISLLEMGVGAGVGAGVGSGVGAGVGEGQTRSGEEEGEEEGTQRIVQLPRGSQTHRTRSASDGPEEKSRAGADQCEYPGAPTPAEPRDAAGAAMRPDSDGVRIIASDLNAANSGAEFPVIRDDGSGLEL